MHARSATVFTRATRVARVAMLFALPVTTVPRTASDTNVRLYTLDCGRAEFKDLWDAGLSATLPLSVSGGVAAQDMLAKLGFRTWIVRPLVDQFCPRRPDTSSNVGVQFTAQGSYAFQRSRESSMS